MKGIAFGLLFALTGISSNACSAQAIFFNDLESAPLFVDPAFTGAFDGSIRITGSYVNRWNNVSVPFVAYSAGIDGAVYTFHNHDYLGAGIQVLNGLAGDGDIRNYYAVGSLAYHKTLAIFSKSKNTDISLGAQYGFMQSTFDLSEHYFSSSNFPPYFAPGIGIYPVTPGNAQSAQTFNAGISISQKLAPGFSYVMGYTVYRINGSYNYYENVLNQRAAFDIHSAFVGGMNFQVAQRLSLRPALYYQLRISENDLIAGGDLCYSLKKKSGSKSVFIGSYYHTGKTVAYNSGVDLTIFRICLTYDWSAVPGEQVGSGGFELALKYIFQPKHHATVKRLVPCNRF